MLFSQLVCLLRKKTVWPINLGELRFSDGQLKSLAAALLYMPEPLARFFSPAFFYYP